MSILDYIEKIKRENEGPRITAQEPRNMAHGGRIGFNAGELVKPSPDGSRQGYGWPKDYVSIEKKQKAARKEGLTYDYYTGRTRAKKPMGKQKSFTVDGKKFNSVKEAAEFYKLNRGTVQTRLDAGWSIKEALKLETRPFKIIDKELLQTIVDKANLSDEWFSGEDISKLYAEATGETNVTKRKIKDRTVTYKKFDSYTIKNTGLLSKEKKIERVFDDILAMDGPVPEIDFKDVYKGRQIANYKKYIIDQTGLGTNFVDQTVNNLPTYKKYEKAFRYLWGSGLAKKDLVNMSLTEQLNWAIDAAKGKPVFTGVSKLSIEDPTFTLMRIAKENWNKNKGAGNIQFYDKNGKKITWKHGLKMNINNVSFSKDKSKKRFTLGDKKGAINVRLEGEKYFPEVFENQRYINELKSTWVDNPFKPGKQIEFGKLMRKVYNKGHGWKPHAPLFSIFHGPKGIAKEPFKNLSFGMQDLNAALYHMDNIPLKGLKQKVINQALTGLKGKKGEKLLEAIVAKHSEHASQVAAGKKFDKPLRIRVLEEVAQTGDLGPRETKFLGKILDNSWCLSPKASKASGGRIGFASGSGCPDSVKRKNFLMLTNDVRTGRVTGEAAEQIAKNAGKVVAKAGSKSALASILGPAGIGIDIAYEVGSVGWDVAKGKPWKEAIQDNWIMGAFVPGTGSEEFHKRLAKINPGAAVYGQAQDLITAYDKKANQIERLKADNTYRGQALAKEQIPLLEKQMKEIENNYVTLTRDNKAMEEGSPEHESYMRAVTELRASDRAKSWVGSGIKRMDVRPDRYKPRGGMEIDYSLPKPVEISETPLGADQLQAYVEYHRDVGDLEPRGELPQWYIDQLQKAEKWRQLFEQPGIRGTQDWRGAGGGRASYMGGGITGIRKPHAIPPLRQGLRSIMINGKKS